MSIINDIEKFVAGGVKTLGSFLPSGWVGKLVGLGVGELTDIAKRAGVDHGTAGVIVNGIAAAEKFGEEHGLSGVSLGPVPAKLAIAAIMVAFHYAGTGVEKAAEEWADIIQDFIDCAKEI